MKAKDKSNFIDNKRILITGGTGSLGKALLRRLLMDFKPSRIVIYSRDELKQSELAKKYPPGQFSQVRYFIGDVRDGTRLRTAMEDIDVVIHAAALKQVPTAEYNPFECIKTNIHGAQNVIESALAVGAKRIVALSTDKAAAPINLYGATKLCSDKLFIAANNMRGRNDIKFSVVRYGNVMGSRGSVIPHFLEQRKTGILPITHAEMTRFNISLEEGVALVLFAVNEMLGGEIFVPKIPSYRVTDLAMAIGPDCDHTITGMRPGEKIHEEMITVSDSMSTIEADKFFVIVPSLGNEPSEAVMQSFCDHYAATRVAEGFAYSSGANSHWLTVQEMRRLIETHVE